MSSEPSWSPAQKRAAIRATKATKAEANSPGPHVDVDGNVTSVRKSIWVTLN
jgi:hypothetical protein